MNCLKCNNKVIVKHGQFVNYLYCSCCKTTIDYKLLGNKNSFTFEDFEITEYSPSTIKKVLIIFSGYGQTSKQTLNRSRIYFNSDINSCAIFCVSHETKSFTPYQPINSLINLITFISKSTNTKIINFEIVGFSQGGIPALRLSSNLMFKTIHLISPVVCSFTANGNNFILYNNIEDKEFLYSNQKLIEGMKRVRMNYKKIDIKAKHNSQPALQLILPF